MALSLQTPSLCASPIPEPALNQGMVGIGLCWPTSSGNTNPPGCTPRTACTWTLEHPAGRSLSLHSSKLHARCPQSPPPLYWSVLQRSPTPTPCLHKTAHKFWVEESWRRGPEQRPPHPLCLGAAPSAAETAGEGLQGGSAPSCSVLALQAKPGEPKGGGKASNAQGQGHHRPVPSPFPLSTLQPRTPVLKGVGLWARQDDKP